MVETRPAVAATAIVASMAIIGYIDNFVVIIAEDASVWQFHFVRSLMCLPFFLLAAVAGFGPLRPRRFWAVAGRSFFMTSAMVLYFAALAFMPIAQVVAGLFTSPIFVVLISTLVLGQRIGPIRIGAVLVGFLGILLVLRPDPSDLSLWTVVPVLAGLFYAMGAVSTRSWCGGESTLSMVAGAFIGLGIAGAIGLVALSLVPHTVPEGPAGFVLREWTSPSAPFLFWTAVQAVGSIVAVWLIVKAYSLGEPSYVGVFEYSLIVFASAWAYVLRGQSVDPVAALGIALVVLSGSVIAARSRLPETSGPASVGP